jgi:hypothetical protein
MLVYKMVCHATKVGSWNSTRIVVDRGEAPKQPVQQQQHQSYTVC